MKFHPLRIAVLFSTIAMIVVNYFAATGEIGGIDTGAVSAKYPTILTPAGYAFSIWSVIYLGMIVFSIYQLGDYRNESISRIRVIYIYSCLANISWIFLWQNQELFLSTIAIFALLGLLFAINQNGIWLSDRNSNFFVRIPFSIYFGWVTAASLVNVAVFMTSRGFVLEKVPLTIVAIIVVLALTGIGTSLRHTMNLPFYALAIAWALTAIAVKQSGNTALIIVIGICVIALLFSSMTGFLRGSRR